MAQPGDNLTFGIGIVFTLEPAPKQLQLAGTFATEKVCTIKQIVDKGSADREGTLKQVLCVSRAVQTQDRLISFQMYQSVRTPLVTGQRADFDENVIGRTQGDIIVTVAGENAGLMSSEDIKNAFKGPSGTVVKLGWAKADGRTYVCRTHTLAAYT